ncbi:amino acid racemase [Vibrio harveyi]|uniref:aspartate/glutamate racemase family protein n=1 Tax=Vibrio harveyi TaxID=669 RepID=UPI00068115FE|nr:aspartate/glutamate racemase family protein [Vibrio harveyi]EKO3799349.1 aspartate/glutamate racemase family protein [Vibrio harveyi]EKO3831620.1 aspartate/glutamate racemase family protein [Vibrio harveyi]EKO3846920.1 aspartate/glutamate racemase family protein [Vibrio harveyi]EKY4193103.1 aspartate/glutamate racemase family protein [Vibrio harveyi]MCG9235009.1 aspartate/glutamate racemase family protein [Vibrio harveyi]
MKTIGLIGGMSWESTANYYQIINREVKARLGGLHSGKVCLYSVDFAEIETLQHQGRWDDTAIILAQAAKSVEAGGADFILICTNTMHKVADQIQQAVNVPLVHIADATAEQLVADGIKKVGLLGTRFTMEQDFYKQRLIDKFGVDVVVPSSDDQTIVHDVIYNELCKGEVHDDSRQHYLTIIEKLVEQGAEAVILGCTEIAMLVESQHTDVKLYDTTEIHAKAAVEKALDSK